MADAFDAHDIARNELAEAMTPSPDDLLADVGPLGCAFFATETLAFVAGRFVGTIASEQGEHLTDDDPPATALAAITTALGNMHHACVALSIYPADATGQPPGATSP